MRQVGERFHVIHHGRLIIESVCGGKRRLHARQATFSFERLQQGGFLPANIRAGSSMHPDINPHAGALNVFADVACPAGLCDRLLEDPRSQDKLAPYINVGRFGSNRVTGQNDPFQHLVRITLDKLTVFKRAGLAFVGIAAEITGTLIILGEETPFDPSGEAGAATTPEAGFNDELRHVGGLTPSQDFLERLVAARLFVLGERPAIPGLPHVF